MSIDLAHAATAPFEPGLAQGPLLALSGGWSGTTNTWIEPGAEPEQTTTVATIEPILGGRMARATYTGTAMGKPHAGMFLLTFDEAEGHFALAWADSFHLGTGLMYAPGAPTPEGALSFLGSYAAAGERWGWRTTIRLVDPTTLLVEATNISPAGEETRAVETKLSRR